MQFTNTTTTLAPSETLDHKVSKFYQATFHSLFRRYLLSTLNRNDFDHLSEALISELADQFQSKGEAHQFLKRFYEEGSKEFSREKTNLGYSDLIVSVSPVFENYLAITHSDLENLGTSAFSTPLVKSQLQAEEEIAPLEMDDVILRKLGDFILDLPLATEASKHFCLDLDFDPLLAVEMAERGCEIASFTRHPEVAALNLLLGLIYQIPVTQHLGTQEELETAFQTGTLPGCLARYPLTDSHLLHLQRWQKAIPSDFFQIYQQAKSVTLLSPTQFLQRDELINFRRELLDREALHTLINFPGSVFQLKPLALPQPDTFPQPQTLWHFSLQTSSPTLRFLDANHAFQATDWDNNWKTDPALEILTNQLTSPPDQKFSFDIRPNQITAPLSMIRLIDFRTPSEAPSSGTENRVKLSDIFDLRETLLSPEQPSLTQHFSTFHDNDLAPIDDELLELCDESGPSETKIATPDEVNKSVNLEMDFLIYPSLRNGRLRILAGGDEREEPVHEKCFHLGLKSNSPENDAQILYFLLCDDEFSDQLLPYCHGTNAPQIHPKDFLNAQLFLPSQNARSKMKNFIENTQQYLKISGNEYLSTPSTIYREWKIHSRNSSQLWHIQKPEDDLDEYLDLEIREATRTQRSIFDTQLSSLAHKLSNKVDRVQSAITLCSTLLAKNQLLLKEIRHPNSGRNPIHYITIAQEKCGSLGLEIEAITSISTHSNSTTDPYNISDFISNNLEVFSAFKLRVKFSEGSVLTTLPKNDFKTILFNIDSNAQKHGRFDIIDRTPRLYISSMETPDYLVIHFDNNGEPLPNGFTTQKFISRFESDGPERGRGLGGFEIFDKLWEYGGTCEISESRRPGYNVTLTLKFPKRYKRYAH